jgi:multiple sugar transport system substrate-binding protein
MKGKKVLSMVLILMLLAAIFAGCTGGGASQPAAESAAPTDAAAEPAAGDEPAEGAAEPYKVYFYAWTNEDNMVPLIDAFNKDYEGQYEMVYQKLANAETMTINTALASGERIDVMTQASAFDLRQRYDSGSYLGLKQFFDKEGISYEETFGPSIEQTQNFDGDYYSIPYNKNINMVFFNKKMFDAAGEPYPDPNWTWDDFRATAGRLTSGEGGNKVYGAMLDYARPLGDHYWASIAQQKLGAFYYYNSDFQSTRFDAPEMKESLQFFYDMHKEGVIMPPDEYVTLKYSDDIVGMNGLYSGKYAMWVAPVYGCLYLNASYGEIPADTDIGMTNFPRPADMPNPTSVTYTSTASIPANVENPEASWAALKYICIDNAELFAGTKANHPGYLLTDEAKATAFNEIIFSNHPGFDFDMAMEVMALPRDQVTRDNTVVQGQFKINELIDSDISLVFSDSMTVDEALADLKAKGDQYIQEDLAA